MFNSQVYRQLWLGAVAAGFITVAGCSNQPANEAANASKNVPAATAKKAEPAKPAVASAKATEPAQLVTVPKGMAITATVGQTLATDKNKPGDSFAARLSAPLQVDGKTVIPKGARLTGHVVTVKKNELKVTLASVTLHGKSYDLETNSIRPPKKAQAKNNDKSADKNSGKGSAASKDAKDKSKKDVTTVPAQTQLTFKLAKPVTVPVRG
jgi:outer membrane murein-binding lipoprotein Lpp